MPILVGTQPEEILVWLENNRPILSQQFIESVQALFPRPAANLLQPSKPGKLDPLDQVRILFERIELVNEHLFPNGKFSGDVKAAKELITATTSVTSLLHRTIDDLKLTNRVRVLEEVTVEVIAQHIQDPAAVEKFLHDLEAKCKERAGE